MSLLRVAKSVLAAGAVMFWVASAHAQDRPSIVVVNKALEHIAARLIDGEADVIFPVPQGVDPSFWRPSITDISRVQSADLILLNGAGFATWVDRVSLPRSRLVNTTSDIKDQFIVTESITHSHGDGGEHSHEGLASYTWLDPMLAIAQAEAIAGAIAGRGIAPADDVYARLEGFRSDLEALDAEARSALAPAADVAMIATHPRYQYFARRFGVSITSLEWDAGVMPTEDEFAELARLAVDLEAKVLIWEAEPPAEAIERADAIGLRSVVFPPLAAQTPSESFVSAYQSSVAALSEAIARSTE